FSCLMAEINNVLLFLLLLLSGGKVCESVFRGFSDCLLQLGDNMAAYPADLDDHQNLHTICSYWDNFHSCATTALADCQEGATELWEKLKKESRSLDFRGSLFELRFKNSVIILSASLLVLVSCFFVFRRCRFGFRRSFVSLTC
uniref:Neuritin 1b n=1 Tax=Mola mola TaxID=94237 RepID=A0A3Q3XGQ8_MOLML